MPLNLPTVTLLAAAAGDPPDWTDVTSAIAAALTFAVALGALWYASRQVNEAQTTRREQAQPYVVVYAEAHRASPRAVEIVVRNFGLTGASDVKITSSPALKQSGQPPQDIVELPWTMPFLAPGQEWRTFWDSAIERAASDLPDRYDLTVTYNDSHGTKHKTPAVLDWKVFRHRMWVTQKTIHDAAESLKEIGQTLTVWAQRQDVVRVATYDGEQYDQRVEEEAEEDRRQTSERQRQHRELSALVLPQTENGDTQ